LRSAPELHLAYELRVPDASGPVVVDVPHAGRDVPAFAAPAIAIDARARDADADLFVDAIAAGAPEAGAPLLLARCSRFVADLNRSADDVDAEAAEGVPAGRSAPRGLVWRITTDGASVLRRRLRAEELEGRIERVFLPYRRRLAALVDAALQRHGCAVLVDLHSCPSRGKPTHADPGAARADVILGWRAGATCASWVMEEAERVLGGAGLRTVRDEPYRGGDIVAALGAPRVGRHALQVELSRSLYMDERSLEPDRAAIERLRGVVAVLVGQLAACVPPDRSRSA
jgi:N-formylglutamate amidohydrolase